MSETYEFFRTFIASPGDVATERKLAEDTIAKINRTVRDTLAVVIDPRKWEHLPPVAPDLPEERLQDLLNREVEQCNFFILILNKRYGTIQPGHSISNTEREIDTILRVHEKKPQLKIMTYFKDIQPNNDPGPQEDKIVLLRRRLENIGIPYRTYARPQEFADYLAHDLYDVILRIKMSPYKKHALKRFWAFGETELTHQPRVAIVYPPVQRSILASGSDPEYWLNHLANQLAFEDYKALQKIEKALLLLGLRHYRIYPHTDPPADLPWMNRIWLCLPRNRLGLKALAEHSDLRFSFPQESKRPSTINWRTSDGVMCSVASPMAQYLRIQRERMDTSKEWNGQLGRLVAKDFAVVAKLQRPGSGEAAPLWDYFLGGIRGLGTWGAAWFIDREYKQLHRFDGEENLELLLEVEYGDGRIVNVTDVSEMGHEYFEEAVSPDTVKAEAAAYEDYRG